MKFRQNFIKILTKNRSLDLKNANFEWIILNKLLKTAKIVTRFELKFCDLSGAKDCKSCRSRKIQQNEYLVAIVAVHTAENEPRKI